MQPYFNFIASFVATDINYLLDEHNEHSIRKDCIAEAFKLFLATYRARWTKNIKSTFASPIENAIKKVLNRKMRESLRAILAKQSIIVTTRSIKRKIASKKDGEVPRNLCFLCVESLDGHQFTDHASLRDDDDDEVKELIKRKTGEYFNEHKKRTDNFMNGVADYLSCGVNYLMKHWNFQSHQKKRLLVDIFDQLLSAYIANRNPRVVRVESHADKLKNGILAIEDGRLRSRMHKVLTLNFTIVFFDLMDNPNDHPYSSDESDKVVNKDDSNVVFKPTRNNSILQETEHNTETQSTAAIEEGDSLAEVPSTAAVLPSIAETDEKLRMDDEDVYQIFMQQFTTTESVQEYNLLLDLKSWIKDSLAVKEPTDYSSSPNNLHSIEAD